MRFTTLAAAAVAFVILLLVVIPSCATGIGPSLPEVLPAIQRLPEEDVTKENGLIVHAKPTDAHVPVSEDITCTSDEPVSKSSDSHLSREGRADSSLENNGNRDDNEDEEWRKSLPIQLQQRRGTLHRLLVPYGNRNKDTTKAELGDDGLCEIYLLGTSHVSKDSCIDARLLMEHIRPDVLFIELCHQRLALLADDPAPTDTESGTNSNEPQENVSRKKKAEKQSRGMSWSAGMLMKIQQDYATKLGVSVSYLQVE